MSWKKGTATVPEKRNSCFLAVEVTLSQRPVQILLLVVTIAAQEPAHLPQEPGLALAATPARFLGAEIITHTLRFSV